MLDGDSDLWLVAWWSPTGGKSLRNKGWIDLAVVGEGDRGEQAPGFSD